MKKILLIEDDEKISRFLEIKLKAEGYIIDKAFDGIEGIKKVFNVDYNLVLLDLMIPILEGEEVCKEIRKISKVPLIIITAKDTLFSKINLLDLGADDYLTKPFEIDELMARIRVVLRNKGVYTTGSFINYSGIKLDKNENEVYVNGKDINLSKTEYDLLYYLIINREIVLSREQIISNVWGYDYLGSEKIVDVYINYLRNKIEKEGEKIIHTVRGIGYILKGEKK